MILSHWSLYLFQYLTQHLSHPFSLLPFHSHSRLWVFQAHPARSEPWHIPNPFFPSPVHSSGNLWRVKVNMTGLTAATTCNGPHPIRKLCLVVWASACVFNPHSYYDLYSHMQPQITLLDNDLNPAKQVQIAQIGHTVYFLMIWQWSLVSSMKSWTFYLVILVCFFSCFHLACFIQSSQKPWFHNLPLTKPFFFLQWHCKNNIAFNI